MQSFLKTNPDCNGFFSFQEFNSIQKQCLPKVYTNDENMIVSAPTSSGKTVIFELFILKQLKTLQPKCLYLAPIKSLCHEKHSDWKQKFKHKLKIYQVTGDTLEADILHVCQQNLIIATPEKIDQLSRQNLDFLRTLNLLLIDEIHMLNVEDRGATLEAIVSRIMSINKQVRIIAVSATIPNISEIAEWLRVPRHMICEFGEEYRPAKLSKVVIGFHSNSNPFLFEKLLNYKLLDVIREHSLGKGSLVFCPTQKGTQSACLQVASTIYERELIETDEQQRCLADAAQKVANPVLKSLITQGIGFHNASLSQQDRAIVEKLFLQSRLKILCTTSTLAMGVNLPARLVIIKSTQCYKGSGKGYQQYTRIEMDQMMGRAGRPPFDTEGTVVIMTEKGNCSRYSSKGNLQPLQSQLYAQLAEHVNAQISLKSLQSLGEVEHYFFNSFCYIRMKKSPSAYGITGSVDEFVKEACRDCLSILAKWEIISFHTDNVVARPLSLAISRNSIQIPTAISAIKGATVIKTEQQYLAALCNSEELKRYRSKLDERRLLKELNEKIKYPLKEAISTAEKKCFVLVQAELSGIHIQNWEMRKQASEVLFFLRRVNNVMKVVATEMKVFWLYYWSMTFKKVLADKFWSHSEAVFRQINGLTDHLKLIALRGISDLAELQRNMPNIAAICEKPPQFKKIVEADLNLLMGSLSISCQAKEGNHFLKISFCAQWTEKLRSIFVCVGDAENGLYHTRHMQAELKEILILLPRKEPKRFSLGIIKEGVIGFDEYYQVLNDFVVRQSLDADGNEAHKKKKIKTQEKKTQSKSPMETNRTLHLEKSVDSMPEKQESRRTTVMIKQREPSETHEDTTIKRSRQLQLPPQYRIAMPLREDSDTEKDPLLKKRLRKAESFEQFQYKQSKFEDISRRPTKTLLFDNQSKSKPKSNICIPIISKPLPPLRIDPNQSLYDYFENLF